MFVLIIQTILLLAIAFILGCIVGCLLRRLFSPVEVEVSLPETVASASAGASASAALKQPEPPAVPVPPIPEAPKPVPIATPRPITPPPVPAPPMPVPRMPDAPLPDPPMPEPISKAVEMPADSPEISEPEPVVAAVEVPKAPVKVEKPDPAPRPAVQTRDNLKQIKGIGPQNEGRLNALGVFRFEQIAKWTAKDEAHYGDVLAFPGRIERESWVEQASVLASGGTTEFAGRVKSGEVGSSIGKADAGEMGIKPKTLSAARGGEPDNLTLIDGVGNAIEKKMFKLGIYHFDQLAGMNEGQLTWLGNAVGFPGRPERENWVGESKILAAGGTTDHAQRVERGEIKTSRKTDGDEG